MGNVYLEGFDTNACLLPIASIAVIYAMQNMPSRLGAIAVFVAVFSFPLNLQSLVL